MLAEAGIAGMRVLWFEREGKNFAPPPDVVAGRGGDDVDPRSADRRRLVARRRHRHAGKVRAAGPGREHRSGTAPTRRRPSSIYGPRSALTASPSENPCHRDGAGSRGRRGSFRRGHPVPAGADSARRYARRYDEQPNLPGTVDEHPNWRRRYPGDAQSEFDVAPGAGARPIAERAEE